MNLTLAKAVIESLVFASSSPVTLKEMAEILGINKETVKKIVEDLMKEYTEQNRGIQIIEVAQGYHFATNPEYADYVEKLKKVPRHPPLSQAALETLAIIAYKQPITRAEIEMLRGVRVDSSLATLQERGLIQEAGRKDGPGRPILYVTTNKFLRYFGLKDLNDLPVMDDWLEIQTEINLTAD